MSLAVNTKDPTAVELQVQSAYLILFPQADPFFVPRIFGWAIECFTGHFKDYQPIDARYHDFEHTLQGTLCMARLLQGRHQAGAQPALDRRIFQLGMIAMLLHDTGYLKKAADGAGTGAKYTPIHVARSAAFAEELLTEKQYSQRDIRAVQNMIHCTGVDANLAAIPFHDAPERIVGYALGTADLLGQMAAEDYVEKLPMLYGEFAEAVRFMKDQAGSLASFSSAEDLMRKTPAFWENFVRRKLDRDFGGMYRFLNDPYPDGPNPYLERIEASLARLRQRFGGGPGGK